MKRLVPLIISVLLPFLNCCTEQACESDNDKLSHVDCMIGTCGKGSQYGGMMPMTGVPFGSAHWVPMTRLTEVGKLSYNESDSLLLGYIGSRQPAIWMGEWGQISFQPQIGEMNTDYSSRGQTIQTAEYSPYYGKVTAGGITTEYSGLEHSAVFEISNARHIVVDASRKTHGACSDPSAHPGMIEISDDGTVVSGWNSDCFDAFHCNIMKGETPDSPIKGYFYIKLSRRIVDQKIFDNGGDEASAGLTLTGNEAPLRVAVGLSLISVEQAKSNLEKEIGHRSVKEISRIAKAEWEKAFARIDIDAQDQVKTIFYTGLYHALLYPRNITEDDQYYSAFDNTVHRGKMYNCWSMWDTYRAEHPLLTLIQPERVDDMMQSLVEMYHEGGWLPKWPNPSYTGIMVGSPAETILAEAWMKGYRGFDVKEAYAAVKKNATVPQSTDHEFRWQDRGCFGDTPETRAGLDNYMKLGYVAGDETAESVSRTQDFGLQDLAAATLADAVGKSEEASYFRQRSFNYKNLWNSEAAIFSPKDSKGRWMNPDDNGHYTECSKQTAKWCVPYDIEGLSELLGGREEMEKQLDEFFETLFYLPERGNKSIHGNEPSHHIAYMYNRIGRPWKTQMRVRDILSRCYSTDRKGFDGNEDCGQMSAWYILSSLGLYMLNPADGIWQLGSPLVNEATLHLGIDGGRAEKGSPYSPATLHIVARNNSPENVYVEEVSFNGKVLGSKDGGPWQISHKELISGGELVFTMTDKTPFSTK